MTRAAVRAVVLLLLVMPLSVFAATRTWTSVIDPPQTDQYWRNPANWVGGVAPSPGDDLVFPGWTQTINDYPVDTNFRSLTYTSNRTTPNTVSGNEFTLTAGINASQANNLNITAPIVLTASQTFLPASDRIEFGTPGTTAQGAIKLGANDLTVGNGSVYFDGPISGSGNLTLGDGNPLGFYALYAANPITGTTFVSGLVNCIHCSVAGPVVLNSGGTWTFTTTSIGGSVTFNGGRFAVAEPTPTGSLISNGSGTLETYVGGTAPAQQGTVNVTGTVTLTGVDLSLSIGLFYTPNAGDAYTIINNDGTDPVLGTFKNLPEGSKFTLNSGTYQITYAGGTGNDVVVTAVVANVPTTTTLTVSPNPAALNGTVTLGASVTGTGGNNPTGGSFTFFDGATPIVTINGTNVTTTTSFNTPGQHVITVTYNAPPTFLNSTSAPTTLNVVAVTPTLGTWALLLLAAALVGVALLRRA